MYVVSYSFWMGGCDRTHARLYHQTRQAALAASSAQLLARTPCPPRRYRDIVDRQGHVNTSQPVSGLVTCHGIKRPSQMREMHRFAC